MTDWGDLSSRARGLSRRLLTPAQLDDLAGSQSLTQLVERLNAHGLRVPSAAGTAAELDRAVRRDAAAQLALLSRWAGAKRRGRLAVVFEEETVRSLRALVRGALEGTPAEVRLAGLVATPDLPERALQTLAEQSAPGSIASLLSAWRHPYGPPLLRLTRRGRPDRGALEAVLLSTYLEQAEAGSEKEPSDLERFVRRTRQLLEAEAALIAHGPGETELSGLPASLRDTNFARILRAARDAPERLEADLLAARIAETARWALERPLGPAPILAYSLKLRAQLLALRELSWGIALRAPAGLLRR